MNEPMAGEQDVSSDGRKLYRAPPCCEATAPIRRTQSTLASLLVSLLLAAASPVAAQDAVIKVTRVRIAPVRAATNDFHCDVFCGGGREEMIGQIVVSP